MEYIRIDDIGASTKKYLIYGKNSFKIGNKYRRIAPAFISNFLFIKNLPFISGWGSYKEMDAKNWIELLSILKKNKVVLNAAITACWVEKDGSLIRFDKKFPESCEVIKQGIKDNLIYILNHGLTHCIPGKHLPLLFKSNQKFHREFNDFLTLEDQTYHLESSQNIFNDIFGEYPDIFVPPGNVYNENTLKALNKVGLKYIQCHRNITNEPTQPTDQILNFYGIKHINNDKVLVIHDRDLIHKSISSFVNYTKNNKCKSMRNIHNNL